MAAKRWLVLVRSYGHFFQAKLGGRSGNGRIFISVRKECTLRRNKNYSQEKVKLVFAKIHAINKKQFKLIQEEEKIKFFFFV